MGKCDDAGRRHRSQFGARLLRVAQPIQFQWTTPHRLASAITCSGNDRLTKLFGGGPFHREAARSRWQTKKVRRCAALCVKGRHRLEAENTRVVSGAWMTPWKISSRRGRQSDARRLRTPWPWLVRGARNASGASERERVARSLCAATSTSPNKVVGPEQRQLKGEHELEAGWNGRAPAPPPPPVTTRRLPTTPPLTATSLACSFLRGGGLRIGGRKGREGSGRVVGKWAVWRRAVERESTEGGQVKVSGEPWTKREGGGEGDGGEENESGDDEGGRKV